MNLTKLPVAEARTCTVSSSIPKIIRLAARMKFLFQTLAYRRIPLG